MEFNQLCLLRFAVWVFIEDIPDGEVVCIQGTGGMEGQLINDVFYVY
jgi:hypothetical protein